MAQTLIQVENISKKFKIGQERPDTLISSMLNVFKKNRSRKDFWALKDINFEVQQGEVLGIIGPNGAGKSTLLKILSKITPPTTGRAKISGRISSLLEVGTGFHPELTGRENIFLNGAILGMSRIEIKKKFDEIVNFADIGKFLDTPVKHYSSGMYVRLAFAVAAHLEPEILVIDEVLAVGDAKFQKKCLGEMGDMGKQGRTILLVSHNMHSILSLSNKCILLNKGKMIKYGPAENVIRYYLKNSADNLLGQTDLSRAKRTGNGQARFKKIFVKPLNNQGRRLPYIVTGCDLEFETEILAKKPINSVMVALIIYDEQENRLIDANTLLKGEELSLERGQKAKVKFHLKNVRLKPDNYTVGLWLGILSDIEVDWVRYATSFKVETQKKQVIHSAPFPGIYECEYSENIQIIK